MSMFDDMKEKAGDAVDEHGEQVSQGADKAGEFLNEKTGGEHADQINQGLGKGKEGLDNLDGQDDDIP